MVFLHINKESKNHKKLDECIKDGNKKIFLLVFMIGCGPCEATKPHWLNIENSKLDDDLKKDENIPSFKESNSFNRLIFLILWISISS